MMHKSSINAFLTDSESLKSLIALCAAIYFTAVGILPPEVGMIAITGGTTGYGAIRQWGKNAQSKADAIRTAPGLDEQELLEAKDEMKGILKALKEKGQ